MNNKVYKIRDKKTKLFSRGGTNLHNLWNKQGKVWGNIGHVKNHIIQYMSRNKNDSPYINAEIIEIDINYDNFPKFDVSILYDELEQKHEEDSKRAEEKWNKYREELERKQLEELKRKYER